MALSCCKILSALFRGKKADNNGDCLNCFQAYTKNKTEKRKNVM